MTEAAPHSLLIPVHLESSLRSDDDPSPLLSGVPAPASGRHDGHIDIIRNQTTVRLHGQVDPDTLRIVLQGLAL
jgi:hypothetical protein